jgi:hypothetical protein
MLRVRDAAFNGSRAEEFDAEHDEGPRANQLPSSADTLTLRRVGVMPFLKGLMGSFFTAFENVFGQ